VRFLKKTQGERKYFYERAGEEDQREKRIANIDLEGKKQFKDRGKRNGQGRVSVVNFRLL
jgi:hypothetical protein